MLIKIVIKTTRNSWTLNCPTKPVKNLIFCFIKRDHHRTLIKGLWLRQAKAHYLRLAKQARQPGQPGCCCNEVFFLDTLPFFLRTTKLPVKGLGQREILVVTFCFFRPCSFSLVKVAAAHHCFKSKKYGYQGIPLSLINKGDKIQLINYVIAQGI